MGAEMQRQTQIPPEATENDQEAVLTTDGTVDQVADTVANLNATCTHTDLVTAEVPPLTMETTVKKAYTLTPLSHYICMKKTPPAYIITPDTDNEYTEAIYFGVTNADTDSSLFFTLVIQNMTQMLHVLHHMARITIQVLQVHCNKVEILHYKTILLPKLHMIIEPPKETVCHHYSHSKTTNTYQYQQTCHSNTITI